MRTKVSHSPAKKNGKLTAERVRPLTRKEAREILDAQARRHLNMSGEEFIRRWDAGEFADPDEPNVMPVAMLLPLGRR